MDGFTAKEVSRLAGFEKPWMLNHLEREEIFVPENVRARQHGKHRVYTFRDIVVLRAINRLLKLGARPKRIQDSILTFRDVCPASAGEDLLLAFARSAGLFVVTEEKVLYCETAEILVDLAKRGQLAFSFMVDAGPEIGPAVAAGLSYLSQVKGGALRDAALLEATAAKFSL